MPDRTEVYSLEDAHEPLKYTGCGVQHDAIRRTQPIWSLPKASKDTDKKVFISNKHQQDLLGKDSPGAIYNPKRQRDLPHWGFGTQEARPRLAPNKYPETSNELCGKIPDALTVKYGNPKVAAIGNAPRDAPSKAPDFDGYTPGTLSPGPQRYMVGGDATYSVRLPGHAKDIDTIAPRWSMRVKTKVREWESQTPAKVGPGTYPLPSGCGEQPASVKPSKPNWSINKMDRFKMKKNMSADGRLWDGMGNQKAAYNRTFNSAPSFGFGTSTRDGKKKVGTFMTEADKGPAAQKVRKEHPDIAPRREILKFSGVNQI